MKDSLKKELLSMNDVDFRELQAALSLAENCRDILRVYEVSENDFCEGLGLEASLLPSLLNGSYPFDLHIISRLQSYRDSLYLESAKKNAPQIISFPKNEI